MGLLSFLKGDDLMREKALTGTPAVLEALHARQFSPYPALGGTNLNTQRIGAAYVAVQNASYGWIYTYSPSVRAVVDYIARNVAQLGLKVYERVSDDEREHDGDHPAAKALRNPNPQTPGAKFIFNLVASYLVFDNSYALKFRNKNGDLVLVSLPAHMVGLVGQSHFSVDAYRIYRPDGTAFDVPPEDMIHWRGYNPDDPRKGESLLETLREELAADTAARQATVETYRSGLALPSWIERPLDAPEWTEQARKRFEEDWANRGKSANRRSPVLEEGMVVKQGGMTIEDSEALDARRYTLERVASMYGMRNVPPQDAEERMQFYADVLTPLTDDLASFFDLQVLLQEYDAEKHYCEFNMDEKLTGDDRLKALTSAAGAPPLTRNEARARLNLPAKEGGDELITPLNVTVGGKPSPQVMPIQDPNKPSQEGDHRIEEPKSLNGNGKSLLVARRERASRRRDTWANKYEQKVGAHFNRQRKTLQSKKSAAPTDERWNDELAADLLGLSLEQFRLEGHHASFRLASAFDPGQGENWLKAKARNAAEGINSTTRDHIEERGLADAFALAVSARAAAAGKGYATDVAGFANKAALEQAPDAPERLVVIDGGECEICAEFQGTWPAKDLPGWPSYHPGCNCVADPS